MSIYCVVTMLHSATRDLMFALPNAGDTQAGSDSSRARTIRFVLKFSELPVDLTFHPVAQH